MNVWLLISCPQVPLPNPGSLNFMAMWKSLYWKDVRQWTYLNMDELQTNVCYYRIQITLQITNYMNVWLSISRPRVPDVTLCHCHSVTQCHVLSCHSSAIIPLSSISGPGNYFELYTTHYCELWWIEMSLSFVVECEIVEYNWIELHPL